MRVDYSRRAASYRSTRALPPEVRAGWDEAIASLGIGPVDRVLDVGAGPGLFAGCLDDWFDAPITAVEPDRAMRDEASAAQLPGPATYVAAVAEALPLRDVSHDLAWMSTVVHQLDDVSRAAAELRRVIRPGGRVLVRGLFGDMAPTGLAATFPGAQRAVEWFPTTADVAETLARAGFEHSRHLDVVERWSQPLERWLSTIEASRATDSLLRRFDDGELAVGVERLAAGRDRSEVVTSELTLRLLVVR